MAFVSSLWLYPFAPFVAQWPVWMLPLGLALYVLPAVVAVVRGHRQRVPIAVLNLLMGWLSPAWVAALVWALVRARERT